MATRSCDECKLFVFDEHGRKAMRGGKPIKRVGKPPCRQCPKKSPEEAHQFELSRRNQTVVAYYLKHRATGGEPMDEVTRDRFALIDSLIRKHEQGELAKHIAHELMPLFVRK